MATDTPEFRFPATRWHAGPLYGFERPCVEIQAACSSRPDKRCLISISRHAYADGVLFHLTGDSAWRWMMRVGVDRLRVVWIWSGVLEGSRLPVTNRLEQWRWTNGDHVLEHALALFITARRLAGESVTLYFRFPEPPCRERLWPRFCTGREHIAAPRGQDRSKPIWKVQFRGI